MYAKKGELRYMNLYDATNIDIVVFDLETGTTGNIAGTPRLLYDRCR